ncbi:MAG: hydantoinase/oxoprolinase family protein, partial [Cytophagaceae bacterium]|nr:hydantoinase/oxoprolinase family protein [Gemmatimonadaceae bacterium]
AMIAAADAAMARALRRVSVERGIDPRGCVLVAFGGGGPLHACSLADRLSMTRILVPPHAGVLSALGLALAPERRVAMTSVMQPAGALDRESLGALARELAERAGGDGDAAWVARMRYRGQGHELEVRFAPPMDGEALAADFAARHRARYGFALESAVEIVSARCTRSTEAPAVTLARRGTPTWRTGSGTGDALRDDGSPCDVLVAGRAVIALPDATLLVAEGWTARALPIGGWLVERDA